MTRFKVLFAAFLFLMFLGFGSATSSSQVAPSALRSPISLTVGGTVSAFDPDYIQNKLVGIGAFADLNVFHGLGVEAEGRFQRFHESYGINQDNYLIGPRYQRRIFHTRPYVKVLGGFSNMNFGENIGTGRFTTIAFGGGVDLHVTRRWSVRAIDAEYQYWPAFLSGNLKPYGISAGVSYRIF